MAIIPQAELFSWDQVEAASDLDRLKMLLESLPDEPLMQVLEAERKGRRDDYPIRPVWNSVLAGFVFQHEGVESLRRELRRNAELRQACGFDVFRGAKSVPTESVYSRFFAKLMRHQQELDALMNVLVDLLEQALPGFGCCLAVDSKAIDSHARPRSKEEIEARAAAAGRAKVDGRRDVDADWGVKKYQRVGADGKVSDDTKYWFGYKLHLLVDAEYELPLGYLVTQASTSDCPQLLPLVERLKERHPELVERAQYLSAG